MRFITAVVALASTAIAAPEIRRWPSMSQMKIQEANALCGNYKLSCCNKETDRAAGHGHVSKIPGVPSDLTNGCSQLEIGDLIGVQELLGAHCTAKAACCQRSPANASGGLVNLALPCIALSSLLQ